MTKLNKNQQEILLAYLEKGEMASSGIHAELVRNGREVSLVTIKRELSDLKSAGLIESRGSGRSVTYVISSKGRLSAPIDAAGYCAVEPDKRDGRKSYDFGLFDSMPDEIFSDGELEIMDKATAIYASNSTDLSQDLREKELERFTVELSWKSSKIEGNTYTLLDTERLILDGIEAPGHDKDEARMILNHKEAFKFVRARSDSFKGLSLADMEQVHKILVQGLNVNFGLRSKPVGVTGSVYRPLDNIHQIREAVDALARSVKRMKSPYAKAMAALTGISYIQPFEDGNKRTSRLVANAILLAHGRAPLSYRSVSEESYKEAIIVFYEQNSIVPLEKIFVEQYEFSAENYSVK